MNTSSYTAFNGTKQVATGSLVDVTLFVKDLTSDGDTAATLVFDDSTGKVIDLDVRGSVREIRRRLEAAQSPAHDDAKRSGPGRPKLGVVSREISLLPRHWEWLATQSGGASVTLRKLIDDARKKNHGRDRIRQSQDAAYRFMLTMAGDLKGYEEALRALYAKNVAQFRKLIADWPKDVRLHATKLSKAAFQQESGT